VIEKINQQLAKRIYSASEKSLKGFNTPLHFAVYYENLKVIRYLLKDRNVNVQDKNS
jgi:ankyrin repeat protein